MAARGRRAAAWGGGLVLGLAACGPPPAVGSGAAEAGAAGSRPCPSPRASGGSSDAHHYYDAAAVRDRGELAHVGDRGFVMVRAAREPAAIRAALERGAPQPGA